MAIVFKNPMPSAGALFVSNPRKRRNAGKRKRRSNGAITRTKRIIRQIKRPDAEIANMSGTPKKARTVASVSADQIKKIDAALATAEAKASRQKRKAKADYFSTLGKGVKIYEAEMKRVGKMLSVQSESSRKPKSGYPGTAVPRTRTLWDKLKRDADSGRRVWDRKRKATATAKAKSSTGGEGRKGGKAYSMTPAAVKARMARYYTRQGHSVAEANKLAKADYDKETSNDFDSGDSMGIASNPRRRKNSRRTARNPWFGAKGPAGGHAGAAYIRWKKTAKGKKLLAAYHKSKLSGKGKKATGKMKLFAIVAKEYAGKRYKTPSSRLKAIWREVRKRHAGKKTYKKRPSSARKKAASKGKANKWIAFMKKMGSRGLTMTQLKRLYRKPKAQQQLAMQRLKKMRKRKGESSAAAKKRYQKRARGMVRQRGKRQPQMGPWLLKLNPRRRNGAVSKAMGLVDSAKMMVGKFPVVGKAIAPLVAPMAVGLAMAKAHEYLEPVLVPTVKSGLEMAGSIPLVGGVARWMGTKTVTNPYLVTGIAVSWIGIAVHKYAPSLLSKNGAAMLGTSAVAVGVAMDAMLKPFAKAAAEVTVEATVAAVSGDKGGFGDGGAYLIGAPTSALGPASFGAIGMDSSQMGGAFGALASEYSDANMLDAHQTPADFHPDEVAAIMSGPQHFQEKFGVSPTRLRKTIHDYSRHAGRPGHRFGWAIKMIGFHNVQKIAALPSHQRHYVLRQLKKQAIEAAPKLIAQAQQRDLGAIETASLDLNGSFNGSGGAFGSSYGALMFAGNNY